MVLWKMYRARKVLEIRARCSFSSACLLHHSLASPLLSPLVSFPVPAFCLLKAAGVNAQKCPLLRTPFVRHPFLLRHSIPPLDRHTSSRMQQGVTLFAPTQPARRCTYGSQEQPHLHLTEMHQRRARDLSDSSCCPPRTAASPACIHRFIVVVVAAAILASPPLPFAFFPLRPPTNNFNVSPTKHRQVSVPGDNPGPVPAGGSRHRRARRVGAPLRLVFERAPHSPGGWTRKLSRSLVWLAQRFTGSSGKKAQ